MDTSSLMEQILSKDNLNQAYLQVVRNKGAEGVDGMKYTELKEHLEKNGENPLPGGYGIRQCGVLGASGGCGLLRVERK